MKQLIMLLVITGSMIEGVRAADPVDFDRDVRPILDKYCLTCHGPQKQRSGLRLDRLALVRQGGDRGPAVAPGAASESLLVQAIAGDGSVVPRMPPKGSRLTGDEVSVIRAWIDHGSRGGSEHTSIKPAAPAAAHWAFRQVARPALPLVRDVSWVRDPIDRFILARLEREGVHPAPEADRATLLRRLSLDLTGLPPTLGDVECFLADNGPGAYERCVERLLAAPSFGERWGRHWLDAAGFADSGGSESDTPRPLWKYREWVIEALNRDVPFDRFVVEQLAGDLLPGGGAKQKIATGLLCTVMYDGVLGQDERLRVQMTVDRVNLVGTMFLGLTLGCAQCHSHKFDPISQREYYQLFAFFDNIEETELELAAPEAIAGRDKIHAQVAALEQELNSYEQAAAAHEPAWEASLSATARARLAPELQAALATATERRTESQKQALRAAFLAQDPGRRQRLAAIKSLREREPIFPKTHVVRESAPPRTTRILRRGEFSQPGDPVLPGVPAVLPSLSGPERKNRLDLARWLVQPNHPLTARVMVNRVWEHYFGMGLVPTEDNFGTSGEPPSHPELLDWLADEFITRGWSLKALHRLIVTSATYRQSSRARPELAGVDPSNRLLARQARLRLEAEAIRDIALSVSGLLFHKLGGPSVFPFQPEGIMNGRADRGAWVVSPGADRYRRGMYTHFWRLTPHPFLRLFDAPDATAACTRRIRTNTPLQALTLLNDPSFTECARALADRLRKEIPQGGHERIRHAFRVCLCREPTARELQKVARYVDAERAAGIGGDAAATPPIGDRRGSAVGVPPAKDSEWVGLARALLNLDEFITRE
jgi:Protein of unknown function (DUF1553)/Protein of unknown function (DUF1549)/Planctomycete cytochrome C